MSILSKCSLRTILYQRRDDTFLIEREERAREGRRERGRRERVWDSDCETESGIMWEIEREREGGWESVERKRLKMDKVQWCNIVQKLFRLPRALSDSIKQRIYFGTSQQMYLPQKRKRQRRRGKWVREREREGQDEKVREQGNSHWDHLVKGNLSVPRFVCKLRSPVFSLLP